MPKIYTTMQGRRIDVDKLRARNEQVRAIGNMPVNARGDQIGAGGKIVKTREEVAKDYYNTKAYNESNPKAASDVPTRNQTVETMQPTPVAVQTAQPNVETKKTKTVKKTVVKKEEVAETKIESKSVEQPKQETQIETNTASGIDAAFDD